MFYHTSKILKKRKLEKSIFSMLFLKHLKMQNGRAFQTFITLSTKNYNQGLWTKCGHPVSLFSRLFHPLPFLHPFLSFPPLAFLPKPNYGAFRGDPETNGLSVHFELKNHVWWQLFWLHPTISVHHSRRSEVGERSTPIKIREWCSHTSLNLSALIRED